MTDATQLNALALAYIGDAVLELSVRKHLVDRGYSRPNDLHKRAIRYVSAEAQAWVLGRLLQREELDEEEHRVVRRGRNAKSASIPKHTSVHTYRYGTAFEALIGFHHLNGNEERAKQLIRMMVRWVEEEGEGR